MANDFGVIADYYLIGIQLGILNYEQAISWAEGVVEEQKEPPVEIIEVALSQPKGRNGVMDALRDVEGERNLQWSGAMLLSDILQRLVADGDLQSLIKMAIGVSCLTKLPDDFYWELDRIDDEFSLVEQGVLFSMDDCRKRLHDTLSTYLEQVSI
ncbi:hypothetical protein [Hahella ganghwensis]|uniref:hypothetical protein n=1 Tax=Hahella ganghwensis TaxID=286420 RepID=UPI000371B2E0|nr:hypothetical protein [Hahella ganghwensis]